MTIPDIVFPLASAAALLLGAAVLVRGQRLGRDVAFALGMTAFALDALAGYVLLGWTIEAADRDLWLRIVMTAGVVVLWAWGIFIVTLLAPASENPRRHRRLAMSVATVLAGVLVVPLWATDPFLISDLPGPFYAARLTATGAYAAIGQVLATVGLLAGLEICLRMANREARWRLKFLVLGVGGMFLIRFYLLSHVLLFHVVLAAYLTTAAAALVLATVAIGVSALRAPFGGNTITMSRSIVLRSAVVGLLGVYLFVVGGLGWVLDRLGMSEELFWGSLLVFIAAGVAGALTLSEQVRWRVKRFVGVHFYRSKYDYRAHWMSFSGRLGASVALEELAPQLLATTADAVGTAKGLLYLGGDDGYQLGAALEVFNAPSVLEESHPLVQRARASLTALPIPNDERPICFPQAALLLPIAWQGKLTGIMVLAAERTGAPYSAEDLEFLATVGVQMAAAIVTTRLSETVARAREFEAFHRLTSFVVHDLKNATSSLSMLTQNALQHFDNPEFQRDAITTLSKTVGRMRSLLARLASTAEVPAVDFQRLDLAAMLADRIARLASAPHINLKLELAPATILGDVDALERVFQNLVVNAVEALDGGGELTVRSLTRDGQAVCEVADTGCGMSQDFLRRSLFVPFRSGKKGGWGIGLYHAREIVLAHRGRIEVQSEEGRGTTFIVTFPAAPASAEALS